MKHGLRIEDLAVASFVPAPAPEQAIIPAAGDDPFGLNNQSCIGFWCPPEPVSGDTTLTV